MTLHSRVRSIAAILILVYGLLHLLGCLRLCYNFLKCSHGMGRLEALYFGKRIFKDYKYNHKLPTAMLFTLYNGAFQPFALYSAVIDFTIVKPAFFAVLLAFTIYSGFYVVNQKTHEPEPVEVKLPCSCNPKIMKFFIQLTLIVD